jgi:hypothetical protein
MTQIKTSLKSLIYGMGQVENRVPGIEDKLEAFDQSGKDKEKFLRNVDGTCKTSGTTSKDQIYKSLI